MRLLEIVLHNFGPFHDVIINLRGISSAVVTGDNGTGKSTGLVEGPLWCLFGECRAETDDILSLGATDMSVMVTFSTNGQIYRAIRKRSLATKAGKSDLELQVQHNEEWVSISGARMADTQKKIIELITADYDLITSTGFLLQGNADRFSKATPGERKGILGSCLTLDRYVTLRQAASKAYATVHGLRAGLTDRLKDLESTGHQLDALLATLVELADGRDAHVSMLDMLDMQRVSLTEEVASHKATLSRLATSDAEIETVSDDLTAVTVKHGQAVMKLSRMNKIVANAGTIRLNQAQAILYKDELSDLARSLPAMDHDIEQADAQIAGLRLNLDQARALDTLRNTCEETLRTRVRDYQRDTQSMRAAIDRDEATAKLLSQVPCDETLQARCQFTKNAVEALRRIAPALAVVLVRVENTEDDDEAIARAIEPALLAKISDYAERRNLLVPAGAEARLTELSQKRDGMLEKRKAVSTRRAAAQTALEATEAFTKLLPELELAEQEIPVLTEEVRVCQASIDSLTLRLAEVRKLATRREEIAAALTTAQDSLSLLEETRSTEQTALNTVMVSIGQTEQKVAEARAARVEFDSLQQVAAGHDLDLRHYQVLESAYAMIPVLILENSIPILEQETNTILSKVSSTGMQVRLNTQKSLKNRDGLAETLDIFVRDIKGERKYECYSGGEKFRLDLALRIGLAKLLANRAGARLDTLIIDEGLGSLDKGGLAQLRECLLVLVDEFPLCLVITHIESMQNTFPSQILLTQDSQGSHAEVVS